jgi:type II secretory pathway pseudopilin PulG
MINEEKGFTLIEALVYLGLFALIMSGFLVAVSNIFQTTDRTQTKAMLQEEGDFLLAKINYALTGASNVTLPTTVTPGNSLSLTKAGTTLTFTYDTSNPNNKKLNLNSSTLNNLNVSVETGGSIFSHTCSSTPCSSAPLESVTASFTLQTKTPNGFTYTEGFQTTKYLRK